MNLERWTERSKSCLQQAQTLARRKDHPYLTPLHVALVLSDDPTIQGLFVTMKLDLTAFKTVLEEALVKLPQVQGATQLMISPETYKAFDRAEQLATSAGDQFVTVERLLQALELENGPHKACLAQAGVTASALNAAIQALRKGRRADSPTAEDQHEALAKYARDLTVAARAGKLDPVIGRDEDIRRTIQVLSRRTKNNPVLIGEPGVGKTAIVEGLAQRIVRGDVPDNLKHTQLMALDLGSLLAGAKFRGEFEERLKAVLHDITEAGQDVVLFIDELHTLVGAGKSDGALDASNMLKPALARGELHCLGATTLDEYRQYIEKDAALARRFQPVYVNEPTVEDTISILRGLKEKYEVHHGIRIADSAIVAAAHLSQRYITDRFLPDKAIDLVDEAASRLRMEADSKPERLDELDRRIMQLKIEREALRRETDKASQDRLRKLEEELSQLEQTSAALTQAWTQEKERLTAMQKTKEQLEKVKRELDAAQRQGDLARAGELRYGIIPGLEHKLNADAEASQTDAAPMLREHVTDDDIASIVSRWTGIPVEKMLAGEKERLLNMESIVGAAVVGQDEAVRAVSEAVRRARAGLQDPRRPLGSFLFLGPTGVGKTELCKALANFLFSDEAALLRLDMSEYMERHAVARMVGAPPGYVGYEEGGVLTEAVRRRPYQVILLDEVEKAHPDVFNILLQVLDDGRLTDGQGRTVDFLNTMVILTSNLGSEILAEQADTAPLAAARDAVMAIVRQAFRPEFLNRLDDILLFRRLGRDAMGQIVAIQLARLEAMLRDRRIKLQIAPEAHAWLAEVGYDPVYGARPLRRLIQKTIQNPLAEALLQGALFDGDTAEIVRQGDALAVRPIPAPARTAKSGQGLASERPQGDA